MWRLHTLSTVAWQCLRGERGPIRTPKNRFFERFCIFYCHWNSFSLFCLLFPLASCCRTLPWDKWKKSLLIARSWKNMRTVRSFQTKKPSLKTQIFYVIFLFNSTVELNFAIFYVGGHDYRCWRSLFTPMILLYGSTNGGFVTTSRWICRGKSSVTNGINVLRVMRQC